MKTLLALLLLLAVFGVSVACKIKCVPYRSSCYYNEECCSKACLHTDPRLRPGKCVIKYEYKAGFTMRPHP